LAQCSQGALQLNFEQFDLDPCILDGVDALGYTEPTPIQEQAIPAVLEGNDLLGVAQTGTGKTAAFILPILQRMMTDRSRRVRALIVAPTRELAEQIHQTAVDLGAGARVRSVAIYGGVSKNPQISALRRGADIVVACPGRLLDHLRDGAIDISQIDVLVLDEADMMCDMGFLPDVRRILEYVPKQRQTLFFSATMPDEIRALTKDILTNPTTVQIGMMAPVETVSHALYPVGERMKTRMLLALLHQVATGRVLVFTRTKHRARRLAEELERKRYRVAALQGNMAQARRQRALDGFRDGKFDILVATDIASRGIDVSQISHVINYDMPMTVDAYTHRIGRTGRAQETGEALTLMVHDDESLVRRIEKLLRTKIERRRMPDFDYGGYSPARPSTDDRNGRGASRPRPDGNGRRRDENVTRRDMSPSRGNGSEPRRNGRPAARPQNPDASPVAASNGRSVYRAAPSGSSNGAGSNGPERRRRPHRGKRYAPAGGRPPGQRPSPR
jgi:ATP-dependent RNA helicase RhlE|tara:strand:- start:5235 stop:6740 length:1506 start_codon:yes stop_codon:yes gene_type:complete